MSGYKNDEKHNEMEKHITKGGIVGFSKKPQKNDHLKLVDNEVDDSVSIYNATTNNATTTTEFHYDDFVMSFTGDNKDNNFKKAMKRLNLIRVLIEKSIRFKKDELSEFKNNIEKGVMGKSIDPDLDLLLNGSGTHVLKNGDEYTIGEGNTDNSEGTQYFTPYTMMYDIMKETETTMRIKQLVEYLIKCGENEGTTEKKSITDGLKTILTGELNTETYKSEFLDNVYTKVFETIATGNSEGTTTVTATDQNEDPFANSGANSAPGQGQGTTEATTTGEGEGTTTVTDQNEDPVANSAANSGANTVTTTGDDQGTNSALGGQKSKTLKRKQQTHNKSRRRFAYGGRKAYEQRKKQRQQQKQN